MQLTQIPVEFNPIGHTYTDTRTGKPLSGITSTLLHRLFPDKYDGISGRTLERAAEHGKEVHTDIDYIESIGTEPETDEGRDYIRLRTENNLHRIASEYLVSDLQRYASSIDIVFADGEDSVTLADIKTTAELDRDYVSWQLSIYKRLFLLANPGIKVTHLYAIHLRDGKARLIEVPEIDATDIDALIQADTDDKPFHWESPVPSVIRDSADEILSLTEEIKAKTARLDLLKKAAMEEMLESKVKTCDLGTMRITLREPSERRTFDAKAFRTDHAELYTQYERTTQTGASLNITIR